MIRISILVLTLAACHKPPAVVQSCTDNLSGTWRADDERKSQFKIADDGKEVVLEPLYPIAGDYGAFKTLLARTKDAKLAGVTTTTFTQNGKTCPVKFASRVDWCKANKLELWGETQFQIKIEDCSVVPNGVMQAATLTREKP